jgi:hypothetical protein
MLGNSISHSHWGEPTVKCGAQYAELLMYRRSVTIARSLQQLAKTGKRSGCISSPDKSGMFFPLRGTESGTDPASYPMSTGGSFTGDRAVEVQS